MTCSRFVPALALLLTSGSYGEVPNVFTAGTTAKASEVNENFQVLSEGVETLDGRVTEIESVSKDIGCKSAFYGDNYHQIEYTPKSSVLGQRIVVIDQPEEDKDNAYRIVKFPIVEFGTGDIYHIKLPVSENEEATGQISQNISTSHHDNTTNCSNLEISGFPARTFGLTESRSYQLRHGDIATSNNEGSATRWGLGVQVQIKINETVFQIYFSASELESRATVVDGDYDLTDNLDTSVMVHRHDLMKRLDDLIDYIEITKVN